MDSIRNAIAPTDMSISTLVLLLVLLACKALRNGTRDSKVCSMNTLAEGTQ